MKKNLIHTIKKNEEEKKDSLYNERHKQAKFMSSRTEHKI